MNKKLLIGLAVAVSSTLGSFGTLADETVVGQRLSRSFSSLSDVRGKFTSMKQRSKQDLLIWQAQQFCEANENELAKKESAFKTFSDQIWNHPTAFTAEDVLAKCDYFEVESNEILPLIADMKKKLKSEISCVDGALLVRLDKLKKHTEKFEAQVHSKRNSLVRMVNHPHITGTARFTKAGGSFLWRNTKYYAPRAYSGVKSGVTAIGRTAGKYGPGICRGIWTGVKGFGKGVAFVGSLTVGGIKGAYNAYRAHNCHDCNSSNMTK